MSGTLVHKQSDLVTRTQLRSFIPPAATATWRPIAHTDLIEAIERELGQRHLAIKQEQFAVQRHGARLFAVLDLAEQRSDDFAAAMGIRHSNDRSMAVEIAVGVRVFVCDNLAFSGDLIALRRKHTARLDLAAEISLALDRYQHQLTTLHTKIDDLKALALTEPQAKTLILDAFRKEIVPVRFLKPICSDYFRPTEDMTDVIPRTRWALHNAFTRAIRELPPVPAFRATTDLGRFFGLSAKATEGADA
jgi:hypothetical protein